MEIQCSFKFFKSLLRCKTQCHWFSSEGRGYPLALAPFWSSCGVLFPEELWVHCHSCLPVLNWFKMLSSPGPFDCGEKPGAPQCQICWARCLRHTVAFSRAFLWLALDSSIHPIVDHASSRCLWKGTSGMTRKVARLMGWVYSSKGEDLGEA